MNGVTIFNHSARQILGNLGMAFRVSGWFFGLLLLGLFGFYQALPTDFLAALRLPPEQMADAMMEAGAPFGFILLAIVGFIFVLWSVSLIAIVWHRFILLEETPQGLIPYRKEFRVGRYFWTGIGISLLAAIVAMVIGGILLMILGPSIGAAMQGGGQGGGAVLLGLLGALLTSVIVTVFYLRMALILPGIALDEGLTLAQSWEASKGFSGAIAMLAVMMAVLNIAMGFVLDLFPQSGGAGMLRAGAQLAFNWFYFMLNISILSTLYGLILQKREVY